MQSSEIVRLLHKFSAASFAWPSFRLSKFTRFQEHALKLKSDDIPFFQIWGENWSCFNSSEPPENIFNYTSVEFKAPISLLFIHSFRTITIFHHHWGKKYFEVVGKATLLILIATGQFSFLSTIIKFSGSGRSSSRWEHKHKLWLFHQNWKILVGGIVGWW